MAASMFRLAAPRDRQDVVAVTSKRPGCARMAVAVVSAVRRPVVAVGGLVRRTRRGAGDGMAAPMSQTIF